jgi:hypothetical protein
MEKLVEKQASKVSAFSPFLSAYILIPRPMAETKLLKTNKSYALGRKDRPLVIASKKISHDHCDIVVGDYTVDDVVRWKHVHPSLYI